LPAISLWLLDLPPFSRRVQPDRAAGWSGENIWSGFLAEPTGGLIDEAILEVID